MRKRLEVTEENSCLATIFVTNTPIWLKVTFVMVTDVTGDFFIHLRDSTIFRYI